MAAQSGKAIVVSFMDDGGTPAYQVVAGLRSRRIALNSETVDVTHAESTGQWRELLAGVGVRSVTISGDGVFTDAAGAEAVRDAFFEHEHRTAKILIPDYGTFEGTFQVTSLEFSGEHNGDVQNSMTFESAGEVTFTAV